MEESKDKVKAIVALARLHTNKLLFLGTPPIGKTVVEFKGQEYAAERLQQYEECLETIVRAADLPFVPTRPAFVAAGLSTLYAHDDILPNDAGHQLIADVVRPELEKLLT